jgi:hypothetical protein
VIHEMPHSVNADTNHENGHVFKPWNAQSPVNGPRKKLKNVIGSKLKLAWKYGMMMKATSYSTLIGMYFYSLKQNIHLNEFASSRWRHIRQRRLEAEEAADDKARRYEEAEAENLRRESEDFLARQMDEMQALAEEQRKAGLLLDDGAPVRLNVSIAAPTVKEKDVHSKEKTTVFAHDEEEEDNINKRRVPLVKLDFSVAESGEQTKKRLERIRQSVPHDKETLFKAKVRWDGLTDVRPLLSSCHILAYWSFSSAYD